MRFRSVDHGNEGVGGVGHVVGHASERGRNELVAELADLAMELGVCEFAVDGSAIDLGASGRVGDRRPRSERESEDYIFFQCGNLWHFVASPARGESVWPA